MSNKVLFYICAAIGGCLAMAGLLSSLVFILACFRWGRVDVSTQATLLHVVLPVALVGLFVGFPLAWYADRLKKQGL